MNKYPFDIKLNNNLKDDVMILECGAKAYAELPNVLKEVDRVSKSYKICYKLMARRTGSERMLHVSFHGNFVKGRQYNSKSTLFYDYNEIRDCAEKLLDSGNFEEVVIKEHLVRADNV